MFRPDVEREPFGRIPRRRLLQIGTAGVAGLSLPRLLLADEAPERRGTARSCIFIVLSGGLSHLDTFDPKPAAPVEIRGLYDPIATSVPGVQVTEMLPRLAQQAHRYALVRSLSHRDTVHVTAVQMMLTGQADGGRNNQMPLVGSLVSKFRPADADVPSNVWLHNMKTGTNKIPRYDSGLNLIGHEHAAMHVGHELDNPANNPEFRVPDFDPQPGISREDLQARYELLGRIEPADRALSASAAADRFRRYRQRAFDLITGPAARQAFQVQQEPAALRERYGRHPIGQYLLMARRLVEAGVRLVTVTAWPGLAPGETEPTITQVWDMHGDRYRSGDNMYGNGPFGMKWSLPRLDQGVSALLEDLDARGLLDETLVVLLGEFGRTPKFESQGRGRGHWSQCYSALLAGGGVRGGALYGASDGQGALVARGRRLSSPDVAATLLDALGIPPETRYGPDGSSLRVSTGEPLREIFG